MGACFVTWLLVALTAVACGADDGVDRTVGSASSSDEDELLAWTGFADHAGLAIVLDDHTRGIDTLVEFTFEGSAPAVESALAAAEFAGSFEPGIGFQTSSGGVDLATLTDRHVAQDRWTNEDGQPVVRIVVRGTKPDGSQLLHLWAFTT